MDEDAASGTAAKVPATMLVKAATTNVRSARRQQEQYPAAVADVLADDIADGFPPWRIDATREVKSCTSDENTHKDPEGHRKPAEELL